jgi:hypothetical protein
MLPEGEIDNQGQLAGLLTEALKVVAVAAETESDWLAGAAPPAAPVKESEDGEIVRLPPPVLPLTRTTTGREYVGLAAPGAATVRLAAFSPFASEPALTDTRQVVGVFVEVHCTVIHDAVGVTVIGRVDASLAAKVTLVGLHGCTPSWNVQVTVPALSITVADAFTVRVTDTDWLP